MDLAAFVFGRKTDGETAHHPPWFSGGIVGQEGGAFLVKQEFVWLERDVVRLETEVLCEMVKDLVQSILPCRVGGSNMVVLRVEIELPDQAAWAEFPWVLAAVWGCQVAGRLDAQLIAYLEPGVVVVGEDTVAGEVAVGFERVQGLAEPCFPLLQPVLVPLVSAK